MFATIQYNVQQMTLALHARIQEFSSGGGGGGGGPGQSDKKSSDNVFINPQFTLLNSNANIGITHVFPCINICRVPRMLFEHEADRPRVQHHSRDLQ